MVLDTRKIRLESLEVGRFVAALLVAVFHIESSIRKQYPDYTLDIFRYGHAGVEYFFVLSGFVMYWVHNNDIGKSGKGVLFLKKRAARILPMYWLAFFAMLVGLVLFPNLREGATSSIANDICDFFLLPHKGEMILGVAWTLRQELVFYLVFVLIILLPKLGWAPLIAWQSLILLALALGLPVDDNPWLKATLSIYNLGFGVGVLTAYGVARWQPARPALLVGAGLLACAALMFTEWRLGQGTEYIVPALGEHLGPVLYIAATCVLIYGLAALEIARPRKRLAIVALLGSASFTLYLFHGLMTSVVIRGMRTALPQLDAGAAFPILVAIAIFGAIFVHVAIEAPTLSIMRPKLRAYG